MSRTRLVLSVVLLLLGLVWIGQGVGIIGGAMSGAPIWAVIGAALVLAAAILVARSGGRPAASS